jgi:hypothetical protein
MPADFHLELVTVLEARDSIAVSLAKGTLEEAGVPYVIVEQGPPLPSPIWGGAGIGGSLLSKWASAIQVPREFEARARELLDPLRNPEP